MSDNIEKTATPKKSVGAKSAAKPKARKAAGKTVHKAVAKTPSKTAPAVSTVYNFPPRLGTATKTMETFMTQKKNQYDKIAQDAAAAQKDHMDAVMQSGNIAMKGMEDISKTCMTLAQTAAEKNAQAFKSLFGCKTLNEFTETYTRISQTNFDDIMSGATRLSELTVKLATDAFEPITEQLNRTMKFANGAMAA